MRFLNGLLGAVAGLGIAAMIAAAFTGTFDQVATGMFVGVHFVLALVAAGVIAFFEKPAWSWKRYAITGVFTSGLLLSLMTVAVINLIGLKFGPVPLFVYAVAVVPCVLQGICTGVGYRALVGAK